MTQVVIVVRDGKLYSHDFVNGLRPAMRRFCLSTERDVLAAAMWYERNGKAEMADQSIEEWIKCHPRP